MLTDVVEEDHMVPDELISGQSLSPVSSSYFLPDPTDNAFGKSGRSSASRDRQLWSDIEDILALEEISEATILNESIAPKTTRSNVPQTHVSDALQAKVNATKRPDSLKLSQFLTPDFAVLINSDTPEPQSPGAQEVPFIWGAKGMTLDKPSQSSGIRDSPDKSQSETASQSDIFNLVPETSQLRTSAAPTESHVYTQLQNVATNTAQLNNNHNTNNQTTSDLITSGLMESIVHIRDSLISDYNPLDVLNSNAMDFPEDTDAFLHGGTSGNVLEERIRYTCTVLDIPMDPNLWTIEQVQRWARFVLKPFEGIQIDPDIMGLTVDGATLLTMTKESLQAYFPTFGETLYSELEVWCFGMTSPSNAVVPQLSSEPAYVELSTMPYHELNMISHGSPSLTSSMTSSLPSSTSSDSVLPPLCTLMPSQMFVKQEVPEMGCLYGEHDVARTSRCNPDTSPGSSPGSTFSLSNYSQGSVSSGSSSPDDTYDDHEAVRQVLPPRSHGGKHTIQLWQFLKDLLMQPQFESYIRWLDSVKGIFKIEDSAYVAKLWGRRKNRPAMNYDKLSRSIRQYYKKGIIKKTCQSKRLVYQFCPQYNG